MVAKRTKREYTKQDLLRVGLVTLDVTSDQYDDGTGKPVPNQSAIWMRFPLYEAIDEESGTKFDVCHSGGVIIIQVTRKGEKSRYYAMNIGQKLIAQIDSIDEQQWQEVRS